MARSKVSIVNRALDILGSLNITSLTDNTTSARAMSRAYEPVLGALLQKHNWSFAIKRDELAVLVETPDYEFSNQFELPIDYVRIIEVYPKYLRYKVEGNKVLTNASSLRIKYVYNIEDPTLFSFEFSELLSLFLAQACAYKITQSRTKESDLNTQCKTALALAMSNDSKAAGTAEPFANDVWMVNRGYGSDEENGATVSPSFDYGSVS
jgi:hypothetical protein